MILIKRKIWLKNGKWKSMKHKIHFSLNVLIEGTHSGDEQAECGDSFVGY